MVKATIVWVANLDRVRIPFGKSWGGILMGVCLGFMSDDGASWLVLASITKALNSMGCRIGTPNDSCSHRRLLSRNQLDFFCLSVFAAFLFVSLLFDFTTLVYFDIWPLVDIVRFCVGTYPLIDLLFKLLFWWYLISGLWLILFVFVLVPTLWLISSSSYCFGVIWYLAFDWYCSFLCWYLPFDWSPLQATVLVLFDIWPLIDIVRFCVGIVQCSCHTP